MENNTMQPNGSEGDIGGGEPESLGGFGFSIGFSLGILVLLIIITYFSYICARSLSNRRNTIAAITDVLEDGQEAPRIGLDEVTIESYPKIVYSQERKTGETEETGETEYSVSAASGCSVCLAEYKDADVLRLLPDCGHVFHAKCVDPWLRLRPTCPVCRNSPLSSPVVNVSTL